MLDSSYMIPVRESEFDAAVASAVAKQDELVSRAEASGGHPSSRRFTEADIRSALAAGFVVDERAADFLTLSRYPDIGHKAGWAINDAFESIDGETPGYGLARHHGKALATRAVDSLPWHDDIDYASKGPAAILAASAANARDEGEMLAFQRHVLNVLRVEAAHHLNAGHDYLLSEILHKDIFIDPFVKEASGLNSLTFLDFCTYAALDALYKDCCLYPVTDFGAPDEALSSCVRALSPESELAKDVTRLMLEHVLGDLSRPLSVLAYFEPKSVRAGLRYRLPMSPDEAEAKETWMRDKLGMSAADSSPPFYRAGVSPIPQGRFRWEMCYADTVPEETGVLAYHLYGCLTLGDDKSPVAAIGGTYILNDSPLPEVAFDEGMDNDSAFLWNLSDWILHSAFPIRPALHDPGVLVIHRLALGEHDVTDPAIAAMLAKMVEAVAGDFRTPLTVFKAVPPPFVVPVVGPSAASIKQAFRDACDAMESAIQSAQEIGDDFNYIHVYGSNTEADAPDDAVVALSTRNAATQAQVLGSRFRWPGWMMMANAAGDLLER